MMVKNRLTKLFAGRPGNLLSVFFTAGFPALDDTSRIAIALEKAGADLIEIGIPFSDPVADGPVIQMSNKAALENGMTLKLLLRQVGEMRDRVTIPIILMGYLNPVIQYDMDQFIQDASSAGVDGVILPDLPIEEYAAYAEKFEAHNLSISFLIAPSSEEERIEKIDSLSTGFVYAVSASSTTGARKAFATDQLDYFERLQAMKLRNPVMIGFGISDHQAFKTASSFGAGAIVGSAFIEHLKLSQDIETGIQQFVRNIKIGKP